MEVRRAAARVLLLDDEDRALLLCFADPSDGRRLWITPGGALERGESPEQAVLRELAEETGLREIELGPCIGELEHRFTWNRRSYRQRDSFFVARVRVRPDVLGLGLEEAELLVGVDWWSSDDLRATHDAFAPADLARRLDAAAARWPQA